MKNVGKHEVAYLNTITWISIHFMNIWGTLGKENRTNEPNDSKISGWANSFNVFILKIKSENMFSVLKYLKITKMRKQKEIQQLGHSPLKTLICQRQKQLSHRIQLKELTARTQLMLKFKSILLLKARAQRGDAGLDGAITMFLLFYHEGQHSPSHSSGSLLCAC